MRNWGSLGSWMAVAALSCSETKIFPRAEWEVVAGESPSTEWPGIAVPLDGGRALLAGSDVAYLYDPSTGLRRVADPPGPVDSSFGAALHDGRALFGGGQPEGLPTDRCFIYDPESDDWSEAARLPHATFNYYTNIAATLPDGRVIVTGGSAPEDAYRQAGQSFDFFLASRYVQLFDPGGQTTYPDGTVLTGSWQEGQPMPATHTFKTHAPGFSGAVPLGDKAGAEVGRATHVTLVLGDGRVLLVGGRWTQPAKYYGLPEVDVYDPGSDQWTRVEPPPAIEDDGDEGYAGRGFPGVSVLESQEVLLFGGLASEFAESAGDSGQVTFSFKGGGRPPRVSSLVFDPVSNQWRRVGDLNERRSGPLAASWPYGVGSFAIAVGGD